mmetsp:Transcript_71689/g.198899  ORF Transcript_71689/g.198899 Transcript_71689/m.198899 type:complete len:144 (+) Transcript_71689:938-1369(+)
MTRLLGNRSMGSDARPSSLAPRLERRSLVRCACRVLCRVEGNREICGIDGLAASWHRWLRRCCGAFRLEARRCVSIASFALSGRNSSLLGDGDDFYAPDSASRNRAPLLPVQRGGPIKRQHVESMLSLPTRVWHFVEHLPISR